MRKNKSHKSKTVAILNYVKVVKETDRELELSNNVGWTSKTKIHTNKRKYNRKKEKGDYLDY